VIAAAALLGYVTAERVGELFLARRNTARLLDRGAVEKSPAHYPLIIALHVVWLAGLWLVAWDRPVQIPWVAAFGALQVLRIWSMAALGERWTSRIIVLPGAPLVTSGPYRYLQHPNYAVVIGEVAVLPLAFGLPWYALVFSLLNAVLMAIRITAESAALRGGSDLSARRG
jgi:methyltransferase